jgi:hypothetical protein
MKGVLAQMGERYNGIVEVRGSIPLGSTSLLLPLYFLVVPIEFLTIILVYWAISFY